MGNCHRQAGLPVGAAAGRLLEEVRQRRLQWRPYGQWLQVRRAGPGVHGAKLPIHRQERHLQSFRLHGGYPSTWCHRLSGREGRRRAVSDGCCVQAAGVRGNRGRPDGLPALQGWRPEQNVWHQAGSWCPGRRLWHGERSRLLAREEQLGSDLGRGGLREAGARQGRPRRVRHQEPSFLPRCVGQARPISISIPAVASDSFHKPLRETTLPE
mmetsp:Transcript_14025/g.33366  ORF Transcript_14025/g.33366 Transcript_14025/m.33366 type:complete len:212 (+) Transcript_14025:494-1129(+)